MMDESGVLGGGFRFHLEYQVSEMVQPLSGSLRLSKATEINPQTINLPQDTIIKVGRGGVSNQGNKKERTEHILIRKPGNSLKDQQNMYTQNKQQYYQTP